MRVELEPRRVELLLPRRPAPRWDKDWFREWAMFADSDSEEGEETTRDLGRPMAGGPGEDEGEGLAKVLFRHFGPF